MFPLRMRSISRRTTRAMAKRMMKFHPKTAASPWLGLAEYSCSEATIIPTSTPAMPQRRFRSEDEGDGKAHDEIPPENRRQSVAGIGGIFLQRGNHHSHQHTGNAPAEIQHQRQYHAGQRSE